MAVVKRFVVRITILYVFNTIQIVTLTVNFIIITICILVNATQVVIIVILIVKICIQYRSKLSGHLLFKLLSKCFNFFKKKFNFFSDNNMNVNKIWHLMILN